MCSQCSDIIANNFTPTESSLASDIPRAPSSPSLLPAGTSQLLRGWKFCCSPKWNICSPECRITHVVFWLMFSVSERSSSPEVWRPGLIQALPRHSKYELNPCLLHLTGTLTITGCHRRLPSSSWLNYPGSHFPKIELDFMYHCCK